VLGLKVWPRPEQPVAQQRNSQPIAEKARDRWLEGEHGACAVKQACPATLVVNLAGRDVDIQEWLVDVRRRAPGQRAACLLRATEERRLAPGAAPRDVWAERPQTGALGTRTIDLARQPERPPRPVTRAGTAKPVTVSAVDAQEPNPPAGEEAVAWLLLTSLPVTDFPRACLVEQWYRGRWEGELCCRVLRPGCQMEQWRVQTDQR
jgi:hypothetical protein